MKTRLTKLAACGLFAFITLATQPAFGQVQQPSINFLTPAAPASVSIGAPAYVSTTEHLSYVPAFTAANVYNRIILFQYQKSTDSGSTWAGPDTTSGTWWTGPAFCTSLTSGTLMVRARTVNPDNEVSSWVNSADTTYAAPPSAGVSSVTGANGVTASPTTGAVTVSLDTAYSPTWTDKHTFSRSGAGISDFTLGLTGAPTDVATSALLRLGGAIASGNSDAGGGTWIGLNAAGSGAGSAADFFNLQQAGTEKFRVTGGGEVKAGMWNATPVTVPFGGTGLASATAYSVLAGGTTSAGAFQSVSGVGSSGQVLTSNGAGALPSWEAATGGAPSGVAGGDLSGTYPDPVVAKVNGNAFPSGAAQGDLFYGSAANTISKLTKDAGASRYLKNSGTSNNPAWAQPSAADLSDGTTGSGAVVQATSPTLVTPTLGVAAATSVNKVAITAPATSATLTIANGKTLTASNSLTFTGTDSTTFTFPDATDTVAALGTAQTFTKSQAINPTNSSSVGLTVQGVASQAAALQEWKNSGGTVMASVSKDGYLGAGSTAPGAPVFIDTNALGASLTAGDPAIFVQDQNNNAKIELRSASNTTQPDVMLRRAGGTLASPSATPGGSVIGRIPAGGYESTNGWINNQANVTFVSGNTWTNTDHSTGITLSTTPAGSTALAEAMRIHTNGLVGIGTAAPLTTLAVNGGMSIKNQDKSASYTALLTDSALHVLRAISPPVITLPAANGAGSGLVQILKIVATGTTGTVTVQRAGSDTITNQAGTTGGTTFTISSNVITEWVSDGASVWNVK